MAPGCFYIRFWVVVRLSLACWCFPVTGTASCPDGDVDATLLQVRDTHSHSPRKSSPEQSAEMRLKELLPLYWVHVPKTGSSWLNTMFHHPRICPTVTTADMVTPEMFDKDHINVSFELAYHQYHAKCKQSINKLFWQYGGHHGLGPEESPSLHGHGLIMLRQPEQRFLSYFNMYLETYNGSDKSSDASVVLEIAKQQRGCVVKQLTRPGYPCIYDSAPPTPSEVRLAQEKLQSHFAFVGITEEWDLSVCLFHAMFGGNCHEYEFQNVHRRASKPHDTSILAGYVDTDDAVIYNMARERFEKNLKLYGVTRETCPSACSEVTVDQERNAGPNRPTV